MLLIAGACLVVIAATVLAVLLTRSDEGTGDPTATSTVASDTGSSQYPDAGGTGSTAPHVTSTSPLGSTSSSAANPPSTTASGATTSNPTGSTSPASSTTLPSTSPTSPGSTTTTAGPTPAGGVFSDAGLGIRFEYPESWVAFSQEQVAGTFVLPTLGVAVGDPAGGKIGNRPVNYTMLAAYEEPGQTAVPAHMALVEWAALTEGEPTEPMEVLEPVSDFIVNGISGAMKTYLTESGGRPVVMRVCFLSQDDSMYVLVFSAEQAAWETYQSVFDETLFSFTVE